MQKQLLIIFVLLLVCPVSPAQAQQVFDTPLKAVESLIDAAKSGDTERVDAILGKDAREIISSGDPVYDKEVKEAFLTAYQKSHSLVRLEDKNTVILTIGPKDWPFAIPIVKGKEGWHFDVAEGKRELLYRRIGFNEIEAIMVCLAYIDAQNEYAEMSRKRTGIPAYAKRVISQAGKKDGLYWPAKSAEEESPLGEFMANASAEGYSHKSGKSPYHGYYYKILTRQGPNAKGGQYDYMVGGPMIGGFALVAWPAKYRNSGVMTFIVNHDGKVYQKDLGEDTPQIAADMISFDPDKSWEESTLLNSALIRSEP